MRILIRTTFPSLIQVTACSYPTPNGTPVKKLLREEDFARSQRLCQKKIFQERNFARRICFFSLKNYFSILETDSNRLNDDSKPLNHHSIDVNTSNCLYKLFSLSKIFLRVCACAHLHKSLSLSEYVLHRTDKSFSMILPFV